jgi:hypothetical protein
MPLDPTQCSLEANIKRTSEHARDQWHSSRMFTPLTGLHCKWCPNTEGKTYENRKHILQRAKTRQMQLSDELIDALDRQGDGQVTELDFVVEMIIALGAEVCGKKLDFNAHVQPLIDRFAVLDETKTGYLTKEDVSFMVKSAREQEAPPTKSADEHSSTKQENMKKWRRSAKIASLMTHATTTISRQRFSWVSIASIVCRVFNWQFRKFTFSRSHVKVESRVYSGGVVWRIPTFSPSPKMSHLLISGRTLPT